jgi:hypothetical protein
MRTGRLCLTARPDGGKERRQCCRAGKPGRCLAADVTVAGRPWEGELFQPRHLALREQEATRWARF